MVDLTLVHEDFCFRIPSARVLLTWLLMRDVHMLVHGHFSARPRGMGRVVHGGQTLRGALRPRTSCVVACIVHGQTFTPFRHRCALGVHLMWYSVDHVLPHTPCCTSACAGAVWGVVRLSYRAGYLCTSISRGSRSRESLSSCWV